MNTHFDPETHTYTIDDRLVPSVTQIVGQIRDFSRVNPERLAMAADLGTAVHEACALFAQDDLDEDDLDPALVPFLAGWKSLLAALTPEILAVEKRLFHDRRLFAGTMDYLIRINGKEAIWDIKTGSQVGPDVGVQLAGYVALEQHERGKTSRLDRAAVHLRPDGTYKLISFTDPADSAEFDALLAHWNWRTRHGI